MSEKDNNDGGPAITQEAWNKVIRERDEARTSLRDRFAGYALPFAVEDERKAPCGPNNEPTYRSIAVRAYLYADAMLAVRDGKEGA